MKRLILTLMTLAACTPAPAPDTPVITVASGNFTGFTSTQIYADGTLIAGSGTSFKPVYTTSHTTPEVFASAAKVIEAEGAKTRARLKPQKYPCMDYGSDSVQVTPPIAGFDGVSAQCPDPAMADLMTHILHALVRP